MQAAMLAMQRPAPTPGGLQQQSRPAPHCLPQCGASRHRLVSQRVAEPRLQQAGRSSARRRHALSAQPPERDFNKDRFEAANKDYADLTKKIEITAAEVAEGLQGTSLFLVGMMGSGKSTIGKLLSQALGYCFFDTDSLIEQLSQKKVSEIFAEDGEESFRELETQVLSELAPFKNCVVATGGGVPTRAENWGHMQGGVSVWLNGSPALLAHRVVGDGTASRPLLAQPEADDAYAAAVARLTGLLEQRRDVYAVADLVISLEGSGPDADIGAPAMEVAYRVLAALNQRIKDDAEERRRRMDFEIIKDELPATMRVIDSPTAQQELEDPLLP